MLVHRRVTPSIKFDGTHLYTWVERGTVRVNCLAQEHITMSPVRARTRRVRSRVERTNHEATAAPKTTNKFAHWRCCLFLSVTRPYLTSRHGTATLGARGFFFFRSEAAIVTAKPRSWFCRERQNLGRITIAALPLTIAALLQKKLWHLGYGTVEIAKYKACRLEPKQLSNYRRKEYK